MGDTRGGLKVDSGSSILQIYCPIYCQHMPLKCRSRASDERVYLLMPPTGLACDMPPLHSEKKTKLELFHDFLTRSVASHPQVPRTKPRDASFLGCRKSIPPGAAAGPTVFSTTHPIVCRRTHRRTDHNPTSNTGQQTLPHQHNRCMTRVPLARKNPANRNPSTKQILLQFQCSNQQ